jgi:hypothetical protein
MGDGNPAPSRSNQDPFLCGRGVNSNRQESTDKPARKSPRAVLFTQGVRKGVDRDASGLVLLPECRSLDDLFLVLESDAIDTLVFDESIPDHERAYLLGWARIFKPGLACESRAAFVRRLTTSPVCVA